MLVWTIVPSVCLYLWGTDAHNSPLIASGKRNFSSVSSQSTSSLSRSAEMQKVKDDYSSFVTCQNNETTTAPLSAT